MIAQPKYFLIHRYHCPNLRFIKGILGGVVWGKFVTWWDNHVPCPIPIYGIIGQSKAKKLSNLVSILFKLMSWQYAQYLLVAGLSFLGIYFLIKVFK